MSVELVAELDTAAGRLLLYLDWWAQLTATSLRLVTPVVHGRGMSVELVAELDTSASRLLLYLDWWAQLTATSLRLVTPVVHPLASTAPLGAACRNSQPLVLG